MESQPTVWTVTRDRIFFLVVLRNKNNDVVHRRTRGGMDCKLDALSDELLEQLKEVEQNGQIGIIDLEELESLISIRTSQSQHWEAAQVLQL